MSAVRAFVGRAMLRCRAADFSQSVSASVSIVMLQPTSCVCLVRDYFSLTDIFWNRRRTPCQKIGWLSLRLLQCWQRQGIFSHHEFFDGGRCSYCKFCAAMGERSSCSGVGSLGSFSNFSLPDATVLCLLVLNEMILRNLDARDRVPLLCILETPSLVLTAKGSNWAHLAKYITTLRAIHGVGFRERHNWNIFGQDADPIQVLDCLL